MQRNLTFWTLYTKPEHRYHPTEVWRPLLANSFSLNLSRLETHSSRPLRSSARRTDPCGSPSYFLAAQPSKSPASQSNLPGQEAGGFLRPGEFSKERSAPSLELLHDAISLAGRKASFWADPVLLSAHRPETQRHKRAAFALGVSPGHSEVRHPAGTRPWP